MVNQVYSQERNSHYKDMPKREGMRRNLAIGIAHTTDQLV